MTSDARANTPRTDAKAFDLKDVDQSYGGRISEELPNPAGEFVTVDFARQLERELSQQEIALNGCRGSMEWARRHLATALNMNPDSGRALEYYAQQTINKIAALESLTGTKRIEQLEAALATETANRLIWEARSREYKAELATARAALSDILACVHQPNPTNAKDWRVKTGMGESFSKAIESARDATEAKREG
jgi:hypothetical protein